MSHIIIIMLLNKSLMLQHKCWCLLCIGIIKSSPQGVITPRTRSKTKVKIRLNSSISCREHIILELAFCLLCIHCTYCTHCIARKVGGELNLVVCLSAFATAKLKSVKISYLHNYYYYYTYDDPVSNRQIQAMAIWDATARFNSCQYFQLYGKLL